MTDRSHLLQTAFSKSLNTTRSRIVNSAPTTISTAYGDVTSFFAGDDDTTGVDTLVNLLLSKIDKIHEISEGDFAQLSNEYGIVSLLDKVEASIAEVDRQTDQFETRDLADKESTMTAIASAKTQRIAIVDGREKKKRVLPGEFIGYHAYRSKMDYKNKLEMELKEMERENDEREKELRELWNGWKESVDEFEGVLGKMEEMSSER